MNDGYFRQHVDPYTHVDNSIIRDHSISLRAKGLYLLIQSYITMPNKRWTKEEFMKMVPEKRKAFDSAWIELKDNGYLHIHLINKGKGFIREYELLSKPDKSAHTFYYNQMGELTKNISSSDSEDEKNQNDGEKNQRLSQKGAVVKGTVVKGAVVNKDNNINTSNIINTKDNNYSLDNPSVSLSDGRRLLEEPVIITDFGRMDSRDYHWVEDYLKKNNGISYLISSKPDEALLIIKYLSEWDMSLNEGTEIYRQSFVLAVGCLTEMITAKNIYEYNGAKVSYANVIDQINALCRQNEKYDIGIIVSLCAEHFVNAITKNEIRNKKQYMKSILWTEMSSGEVEWMGKFQRTYNQLIR